MDRQYIENERIVERYLSGDLTVREAQEFQRFCATHPQLLHQWPIPPALKTQLMHSAVPAEDDDTELADLDDEPSAPRTDPAMRAEARRGQVRSAVGSLVRWRQSRLLLPGLAVALLTAVVALIGLGLHARILNLRLREVRREIHASELQAHSSVQTYRIKLVRGRPQRPTLAVGWPMPPELLELHIDVTEGDYASFQVTIDRSDGSRVLQIRRIARDSNHELRLALNSSAFGRGEYLMKFDGYTWRGQTQELGWIMLGLQ